MITASFQVSVKSFQIFTVNRLITKLFFSDEEFLQLINSSSIKDLQSLQTVGTKRAKLIYDWRETYGNFSDVSKFSFSN